MVFTIQYISIFVELLISILGLLIVLKRKKIYGFGIFITFFIYVFYDLSRIIELNLKESFWSYLFFIATISALFAVFGIYRDKLDKIKKIKVKEDKK